METNAEILKKTLYGLLAFVAVVFTCHILDVIGVAIIALLAIVCAVTGRMGLSLAAYLLFPALATINPYVLGAFGSSGMIIRLTTFSMSFLLLLSASRRVGRAKLPLSCLWFYLVVALISSIGGYHPPISYLKIVNFSAILLGLQMGLRNIDRNVDDLEKVRFALLGFTAFVIIGSYFVKVFIPGAAYLSTLRAARVIGIEAANQAALVATGKRLFAGITSQSQVLAVMLPCTITLTLCDMLFVVRRVSPVHLVLVVVALPLVYMTGSRASFLATSVCMCMILFYGLRQIPGAHRIKQSLKNAFIVGIVILASVCVYTELKDHSMSRWLRKTDDIEGDSRGLAEAVTESRQGLIGQNIRDFKKNPLLGMGFQVSEDHVSWFANEWFVLSAPIEKGLLPMMVLGETGIVGFCVFIVFIISFYVGCARKRYCCTLILMTVLLSTNMAEATFFSPGGVGGVLWLLCIGGGFVFDMISLNRSRVMNTRQDVIRWQGNSDLRF